MTRVTFTRAVAGAAAATALIYASTFSGAAIADEVPAQMAEAAPAPVAMHPAGKTAMPADRDEQRIRKLHDSLAITASQEVLWGQLAQVIRSNDERIDELATERHRRAATMTAVEDLRSYGEITDAHAAGIRAFEPAFQSLYDAMSATQKSNADSVFRHQDSHSKKKIM
jgi:hypothetical protein